MYRDRIREDFDRIALVSLGSSDDWLLPRLPLRCQRTLEIGCGQGWFTRRLAERSDHVTAIDLSPNMIEAARKRVPANVELVLGDVMEQQFSEAEFDCAVSIATLHHLPFQPILRKLARALRSGGVLVIHDLLDNSGLVGQVAERLASLVRRRGSPEVEAAWAAHAENDHFLKWAEVRDGARQVLGDPRIERNLRWRYTLTWRKP